MQKIIPKDDLTLHRRSLDALTGVRFLAAFYVVLFHSKLSETLAIHHPIAGRFIGNGFSSVSLFFLLSGFILAYTYAGRVATSAQRRRFWEARFARLYPVYCVSLLLTMAVHHLVPKLSYTVAAFLMVQAWNPFDKQMWGACNYVCWTLSVEAFFYIVFPWYQLLNEQLRFGRLVIATCGILVTAICLNTSRQVLGYHGAFYSIPLPLLRLPEFMIGVGLGNLFLRKEHQLRSSQTSLLPGNGIVTYAALLTATLILFGIEGRFLSLVLIPFTALILALAAEPSTISKILSSTVFVFGGGISYALYLLQVAAKDFVIRESNILHIGSAALRFCGMMLVLIALSTLAYKGIEIPVRERLRSYFAGQERRRAPRTEVLSRPV